MITSKIQTALMLSALRKAKWAADQDKSYWGSNEEIFTLYETDKRISEIVGFDIIKDNSSFLWGQAIKGGHVPTIIDANIQHLIKFTHIALDEPVYLVAFSENEMTAFDFDEGKIDINVVTDLSGFKDKAIVETIIEDYHYGSSVVNHTPLDQALGSMSIESVIYSETESEQSDKKLKCLVIRLV